MDNSDVNSMHTPEHSLIAQQKRVNVWMIISIILFFILVAGSAYVLGRTQEAVHIPQVIRQNIITPSPTRIPVVLLSPTPTSSSSSSTVQGTVSGTLCYPASMIPPGIITAKSITTGQEFTQNYIGTQYGGLTTYSIQLNADVYHIKFTPTQYTNIVGYYTTYTTCVNNSTDSSCSGQKIHPILPVRVEKGGTLSNINVCDYYYPPDSPPQY